LVAEVVEKEVEVDMAVKVEMELEPEEEEELHEERRRELAGRSSQPRRSLSRRRPALPLPFIESIGAICWTMVMALAGWRLTGPCIYSQ
jgi:hypothetical protein